MTERSKRHLLQVGTPVLLAAITWADYAAGYDLGLFVFYFAPVALAAWYGSRSAGVAFAFLAGGCWLLSDSLSHHPYAHPLLIYWETLMRLVSFLVIALALSRIRSDLRRRDEVLGVISHDLRAPLGALVGQAHLLRKRATDGAATARVDAILRSAARINAMIEDLLDSARQDSGQLQLRLEPLPIGPYLTELLERSAPVLDVQRVRLALEAPEALVAWADPDRLDRIVLNLLLNALKFSPAAEPVTLSAGRDGDWIAIRVVDRGPGISDEELPHLFDRYFRGRATSAGAGLGIGLYSVRLLVEAHGGRVRVASGPERGTTFEVALPVAPREAAEPANASA